MMNRSQQLDYLIDVLAPQANVPCAVHEKWLLLRSLVNIREPQPLPSAFFAVQDALLQAETIAKGITTLADLQKFKNADDAHPIVWQGDITTLSVDGIVNAANAGMLGCFAPCHNCIDNVIHTYAGVQLRLECANIMKAQGYAEPTGKAKITPGYNLPSKYILHTVGPIIEDTVTKNDRVLLAECYRSCLDLAKQHSLHSIAFCCISTGEFHFPNLDAAKIAINTVRDWQMRNVAAEMTVVFNVYKDLDYEIYAQLLG